DKFLEKISPDVSVVVWRDGSVLFEQGTYLDLAFFIAGGEVDVFVEGAGEYLEAEPIFDTSRTVMIPPAADRPGPDTAVGRTAYFRPSQILGSGASGSHQITFLASMDFDLPHGATARLAPGELFGEIGAMSGWPQSVTARTAGECQLVQIRVPALRLMKRKSRALKDRVDQLYKERALMTQLKSTPLFRGCNDFFIQGLMEVVELVSCDPGEALVREGDPADAVYLVRSGFVKLVQSFGDGEIAVSYLSKGMTLGEVEFLVEGVDRWEVTASSVEYAELVKIPAETFGNLVKLSPEIEEQLWRTATARIKECGSSRFDVSRSEFVSRALETGLVQGNSILVIDLESCTRCDDCVRACAATHGGRPRFVREGNKVDNLLIAKSCYHCRDPVCLVGCPTGAIHRAGLEAVVEIDEGICIGCGTCSRNCPYDAIVMHETGELWPGDMIPTALRGTDRLLASKCDLCHSTDHGPACVSNCPQGCAYRVGSVEEIQELLAR
ncbi:MAG: cyclic nucleotide-binding domain-containing protein, partial [Thermoanaerobaculia bacterium]